MRRPHNPVSIAIVLLFASACFAQSGAKDEISNQVQIRVVNLSLQDFSTDKLVIGVGLAANSNRNITVDELVLSRLQLNGVPIYAAPMKRRFKLRSRGRVTLPEQLQMTVYLRDLDSLKPLRDAISNGYATVTGVAVVHVTLNPLERLIALSSHAEVSTTLHQQVAFSVPGGPFVSASLIRVLDLAEAAVQELDSTVSRATKLVAR